jgi:serine/threonine protein kinase
LVIICNVDDLPFISFLLGFTQPENIFIKSNQFKLGDFGLVSKITNHSDVEEGDSRYMSMELLSGDHDDLTKVGIFALSPILHDIYNMMLCQ